MTEAEAKLLANELKYNRYWFVWQVRERPAESGHWVLHMMRKDLSRYLMLEHGDATEMKQLLERQEGFTASSPNLMNFCPRP